MDNTNKNINQNANTNENKKINNKRGSEYKEQLKKLKDKNYIKELEKQGIKVVSVNDRDYPAKLLPYDHIHAKIREPPRDTMFILRFIALKRSAVFRLIPQWIVIKSTPSSACILKTSIHSRDVISFNALL